MVHAGQGEMAEWLKRQKRRKCSEMKSQCIIKPNPHAKTPPTNKPHPFKSLTEQIHPITNASRSLHISRRANYVLTLLPLPKGMEIWRSLHGTSNRATASMPQHWHKLDYPRAALSTTNPNSSQNVPPPAQLPVAAGTPPKALPSTPSSVQLFSSQ